MKGKPDNAKTVNQLWKHVDELLATAQSWASDRDVTWTQTYVGAAETLIRAIRELQ